MPETSVREQVGEIVSDAKRRVGLEKPTAADEDGNVGIVRGALRAFGEGDIDGFIDALKDDVVWEAPEGKHFPGAGNYEGRSAVREKFVADVERTFSEFGFHPESFLDADDENAVVVLGRFKGDGVEGDQVDTPGVQVWQLEGKAVAAVRIITDSAAFPEVVTERKQEEWKREEEEKEKEEQESEGSGEDESEGKEDDEPEGKGEDQTEDKKGDDESEGEDDDQPKGKGDEGGESSKEESSEDDSGDEEKKDED